MQFRRVINQPSGGPVIGGIRGIALTAINMPPCLLLRSPDVSRIILLIDTREGDDCPNGGPIHDGLLLPLRDRFRSPL